MGTQKNKQEQPRQDEDVIEIGSRKSYKPDKWVILKITAKGESHYKVFGMWSGGYLDSDYWRLNSGIKGYQEDGEGCVSFFGYSSSQYDCWLSAEGMTGLGASALSSLPSHATLIPYEQFKEEFNGNK